MAEARTLTADIQIRLLRRSDVGRLRAAYEVNREHLAPWEPVRGDEFFTDEVQTVSVQAKLDQYAQGIQFPWVLLAGNRIVGTITLNDVVRGSFLNGHVGYWVDQEFNGRGIGSAALAFVVEIAREELGLHRLQGATLCHNFGSQKILRRTGFEEIGVAPSYLKIAGEWQDHKLYQRILY